MLSRNICSGCSMTFDKIKTFQEQLISSQTLLTKFLIEHATIEPLRDTIKSEELEMVSNIIAEEPEVVTIVQNTSLAQPTRKRKNKLKAEEEHYPE